MASTYGVEYTHTMGVAELYDYDWYFSGFPWKVHDVEVARRLGIEPEQEVVYFPRRGIRHVEHPLFYHSLLCPTAGATRIAAMPRLFSNSDLIYPDPDHFMGPKGAQRIPRIGSKPATIKILRNRATSSAGVGRSRRPHDSARHRTFPRQPQQGHARDPVRR